MIQHPLMRSVVLLGSVIAVDLAHRAAMVLAGYLVVGLLLVAGLGFLTMAGYWALCQALGNVAAALIAGVAYVMAALITLLVAMTKRR